MPKVNQGSENGSGGLYAPPWAILEPGQTLPGAPGSANEIGYCGSVRHLPDSSLEEYALGRLSRFRAERVEEHVLFCRECQDRLQAEIEFTAAATVTK